MNRPLALVCYICGREFGTKSLGIHIKACEKKWENQESQKLPKQRRPCPRAPPGLEQLLSKSNITRQDIMNFNTGSFDTFKEEALMECEYCGRKFNPKSLVPHQKACKTNPMVRKPYVSKNQQKIEEVSSPIRVPSSKGYKIPTDYNEGQINTNLVPCGKCGRTFAPDRVGKHERICKGPEKKHVPTISEKYELKPAKKAEMSKPQFGKKIQTKAPKWKVQSEELQRAMKQMRKIKAIQERGGDLSSLPPPPRSNYDHYVECRYCGRNYAPQVAERHIPKCANIINKPGGIKPSKIQEKYIQGTGSSNIKPQSSKGSKLQPQSSVFSSKGSQLHPQSSVISSKGSQLQPPMPNKLASKPQMLQKRR